MKSRLHRAGSIIIPEKNVPKPASTESTCSWQRYFAHKRENCCDLLFQNKTTPFFSDFLLNNHAARFSYSQERVWNTLMICFMHVAKVEKS